MKTRKFTKVISFILVLSIAVTSSFIYSLKATAVATSVSTKCVRCDATLGWLGPFLGSVPTPNDSTAEGNYIVDDDRDEYHYYIIKCPDFRSTLLGKKHDNYPASEKHNYTSTYTQHDSSKHTRTYTCTKNDVAYNIVGTAGCGYSKDVLEAHSVATYITSAAEDEYHEILGKCICGYVVSRTPESHTFNASKYYYYSMTQHHITKYCTICQDTVDIYENHKFTYDAWTRSSGTECKRTKTCSDCGYSTTEFQNHTFGNIKYSKNTNGTHIESKTCSSCGYLYSNTVAHSFTVGDWYKYSYDDENWETYDDMYYHKRDCTCDKCGYTKSEYEKHSFALDKTWYDYNATYHYRSETCTVCSHGNAYYYTHKYPEEKFVYNSINSNTHQITKTCADCTRTATEVKSHNFVAGKWTVFGDSDPNSNKYDCNKYHKRTLTCSDCGYVKYEYVEHKMQIVGYTSQNADRHSCALKCSDCTYSNNLNEPHTFNPKDYKYEVIDKDRHQFIKPCEKCDYAHKINEYHEDSDFDCYCDKCGYLMTKFSVTVPTTMVLTMGTDGEVYAPSDVVIINNSTAAVSVKKADINSQNGWNIVPYSTNMANEKVDAKKIGFKMNGIQTDSSGTTDSLSYNNSWIIEKDTSSSVVYDAVVSATSSPIDEQVIEIVYIVDWKE